MPKPATNNMSTPRRRLCEKAYAEHWQQRMNSLRNLLNRNRVDHVSINTAGDYIQSLKALFAQRAR